MPRQARIDAPGALHHIICRGMERRNIFKDNTDKNRFLERLGSVLQKTSTPLLPASFSRCIAATDLCPAFPAYSNHAISSLFFLELLSP